MDEVGAFFRLNGKTGRTVGVRDVEQIVSKIARVPVNSKATVATLASFCTWKTNSKP